MKKIVLIMSLIPAGNHLQVQGNSWRVKLNNTLLLAANKEDEKANTRKVKLTEWKKNGWLAISYTESELKTWIRSFLFFDEKDNQLLAKDSTTFAKIPVATLRKLFTGKKELRIYTIVAPVDPNIAIRIRRVHLCTLKLP